MLCRLMYYFYEIQLERRLCKLQACGLGDPEAAVVE
jgi:hypothetical protein